MRYPLARGKSPGLSEPLPADHPDEAAGEKGRRRGYAGGRLEEFAGGLICFASETDPARLETILRTFGKRNVYSELQRHFQRAEEERNQAVMDTARRLGIPLVATNGVSHVTPKQREVLDVLTCVRNKATVEIAGRLLSRNAERHLKTPAEMTRLGSRTSPKQIGNTIEISSRLRFELSDLGYEFPPYPVPDGEDHDVVSSQTDRGRRARTLPAISR